VNRTFIESIESRCLLSGALAAVVSHSTLPTDVIAGQTLNRTAIVDVIDQSETAVRGSALVEVFASADGVVDSSSILLATRKLNVKLKPGFSAFAHLPIKDIPVSAPADTYALLAEVTDPLGNRSSSTDGPAIAVAAPVVTLSNLSIGAVTPASIKAGKAGNVAVTVTNSGNITSTGSATVELFLATGGEPSTQPLVTLSPKSAIKPGHKHIFRLHFVLPFAQTPGTYALFVTISQNGSSLSALGSQTFAIQ
jgi:hypothetical protein